MEELKILNYQLTRIAIIKIEALDNHMYEFVAFLNLEEIKLKEKLSKLLV